MKVGVWGVIDQGPCSYFRGDMFKAALAERGLELVPLNSFTVRISENDVEIDMSALDEIDVLMFRRYYNTSLICQVSGCTWRAAFDDEASITAHASIGHLPQVRDSVTRPAWEIIERHWPRGIVYETDDLHISHGVQPWNGYHADVEMERDLVMRMARRADIVTVATPALAEYYGTLNRNVVVVRNALDPSLYVDRYGGRERCPHDHSKVRVVYYGGTARFRDYLGYRFTGNREDGVPYAYEFLEPLRRKGIVTTVFIGQDDDRFLPLTRRVFDEWYPRYPMYEFDSVLASVHADIGIAPLAGDEFDRCKSELHWMEYGICGVATVCQRFSHNPAAYSNVRHGIDGMLARGRREWEEALSALIFDADLRVRIGAAARERVLQEYTRDVRVGEWEAVFRMAAQRGSSQS